jgi:hypothetical protein
MKLPKSYLLFESKSREDHLKPKLSDIEVELFETFKSLANCYGKLFDNARFDEYRNALKGKGYTMAQIKEACENLKISEQFFPAMAVIIAELKRKFPNVRGKVLLDCCEVPCCDNSGAVFRDRIMYRCRCSHGLRKFPDSIPFMEV